MEILAPADRQGFNVHSFGIFVEVRKCEREKNSNLTVEDWFFGWFVVVAVLAVFAFISSSSVVIVSYSMLCARSPSAVLA